ncbi:hypothetical protein CNMCM8980_001993 [Aspergillus fumigatiaffinis]|uniref:Transposase Tc1-like domain-containing protein n=1 Tax=Aspergillus fumigatiaffinis TaxID=340414 RepID=A0A8H4HBF6_9EURO|nr:hypothetical protein CNMCM5878_007059 [Aspergillus fumigatiaffinis]KAF4241249.1 hypothetical protein CNMCM6457_006352 [Aspergillus fumigatiaffinis]KAF4242725.1 hypothetical protein CNMCM6805_002349 [Aspergillus fumigatiaffinis]KAF4250134.1 hypothetical protein CNMCM8980_001993 [Aspergillus fumigatiaffinis]
MRGSYHPVTVRVQALTLAYCGVDMKHIEATTGMPRQTIQYWLKKARERGYNLEIDPRILPVYVEDGKRTGRPKEITEATEQAILESISKDRNGREKSSEILAFEAGISYSSVLRILKRHGYKAVKQTTKPGLTDEMKQKRLQFCLAHKDWTLEDWKNVIWTDETSVSLGQRINNPETAEFLCGLEGLDVTPDPPSEPPFYLSRQTWVINKKLSERSQWMAQQNVADGLGLPFAAAKFLCHRKENPSKKAFMRIYLQIPVIGTQYQSPQIRRKQAAQPQAHVELTTLKALKELRCDIVPDLLAYQEGSKPKIPLSEEQFWELDLESRQAIRDKFREAFPHFSGFSRAGRTDTNEEWHDKYYVLFELAQPSPKTDWVKDTTGWT